MNLSLLKKVRRRHRSDLNILMADYSDFEETPKNSVIPNIENQLSTRVYN